MTTPSGAVGYSSRQRPLGGHTWGHVVGFLEHPTPAPKLKAAVAAMAALGIDISRELPQPWADETSAPPMS